MHKILRWAAASTAAVVALTVATVPTANAATNVNGANVTTSEAMRTGFITAGSHASTHLLDGVSERLTEDLGWFGGQQLSTRRMMDHSWYLGDTPAGAQTLTVVARLADADAEPYTFAWFPDGFGRHNICTINSNVWKTCQVTAVTTGGSMQVLLSDGWAVDQLANKIEVDFIGLQASSDVTAPTIAITSPTSGSTATGYTDITVNASDESGVKYVEYYEGTTLITRDSTAPFLGTFNANTATAGLHTVTVKAFDPSGNVGTTSIDLNVVADTVAPTGSITSPADGATVSGSVNVSAIASDNNGVQSVTFLVDGEAYAQRYSGPYSAIWFSDDVANGSHQIAIQVRDFAGNMTTRTITVNVNNTVVAPTPPPAPATANLALTVSGRSGTVTSNPAGLSVSSGTTKTAAFTVGSTVRLNVGSGRSAIFTGACNSGGRKVTSCSFTFNGNSNVTANIQ